MKKVISLMVLFKLSRIKYIITTDDSVDYAPKCVYLYTKHIFLYENYVTDILNSIWNLVIKSDLVGH